jgi:EAL domain-containing protein (putative c-di-GMP-specific phosphodiesterase class I)
MLLRRLLIASERALSGVDKGTSICFYDQDLEAIVHRESEIRKELSRIADGTDSNALYLQYQPILDLKTNLICGFEALARLRTERLGSVTPMEFIPIAEKTKLIIPIGKAIMVQAFQFLKKINQIGHEVISVAINVSAIQLLRPDFTSGLLELIQKMQVDPRNIGIEITESIFSSDYDYINAVILELRDAGLHIAIDDFGTGYSSLRRERELNVNSLKIDKYFIDKLLVDGTQRAITGDIISIAHRLGHSVIAEGVEYEDQRHYLETHDCDMIQGYLISRPLDEDVAIQLLLS